MADVVFILGAGCSVHAGAPVMTNFIERARDLLDMREVEDRREEFELAFETISHLQRVHSKSRLDHNNIETVFSAVDLARTLKALPGIEAERIDAAAKALNWLIVRTLERTIEFETRDSIVSGTSEYVLLAKLIAELQTRTPQLSAAVLTFNYDLAADLSFSAEGLPFTYALKDDEIGVPLLKLHGSLNWFRLRETREIAAFSAKEYRNKFRLQQWSPGRASQPKVKCPVTSQIAEQLGREYRDGIEPEPVLVPPTWSKGEYHREIANVWRRAACELKGARHVFVLGYSLPPTDQFFRLLFALGTEGPAILKTLAIFDPQPDPVYSRFKETLGQAALDVLQIQHMTFGEGLRHIDALLFKTGRRGPR